MNEYKRLIIKLNLVKNIFRLEIVKDKKVFILKTNKKKTKEYLQKAKRVMKRTTS
jgi:hypothetical protein